MSGVIVIKRGDTLVFTGQYKQETGVAMDLTGYTLVVNVLDSNDRLVFNVAGSGASRSVVVTDATEGRFVVVIKDTETLRGDDYWLDIKATGADGYAHTSKAIKLKVRNKLV